MTSFGYRLNPRFAIKECSSCGALYTRNCSCSKGSVEDKILVPKLPKIFTRCAKCGHPVNGTYCQGCALLREKLEEDLGTYLKYFQDTFESSDDSTNVVNAPREPFVIKKDHIVNPPRIDECCCECGNALDGIYCQQCICTSCGKESLVPCVSKPNSVDESSNIFNLPPQPPIYSCEFYGSNAQYGHYCTPQVSFINPEPGYSQDLNFPQNIHDFQQQSKKRSGLKKSKRIEEEQAAKARYWKIPSCCNDDDNYNSAITPVLSTEETDNSLSMGDEHLDIIPATESDEVIKSSVKDLVPIPSEYEGIPDTMCDVHLVNNSTPLEAKAHFEIVMNSNDDISLVMMTLSTKRTSNYEAFSFNNDHIKEISSGSTTTHSDISLSEYDSSTFDLSNDQFPPTDRSDFTHEEFADELAHIISPRKHSYLGCSSVPFLSPLINSSMGELGQASGP
nr:hypothetical protein [Tanacetum cinerariifolium]